MASPNELIEGVKIAIEESGVMPAKMSYLTREADTTGSDANIKLPICEIQTIGSIRLDPFNTDQADVLEDSNGNHIGRIYHSEYQLNLQIDIWVAQDSSYDADALGNKLRNVLYGFDSAGPSGTLTDSQGQNIDDVWRFRLGDGERRDDLTMTPTLRRWRQEVSIWSYETFNTTEDYIATVDYPSEGDFGADGDRIQDAPPN